MRGSAPPRHGGMLRERESLYSRSDAVLRTAMPAHDDSEYRSVPLHHALAAGGLQVDAEPASPPRSSDGADHGAVEHALVTEIGRLISAERNQGCRNTCSAGRGTRPERRPRSSATTPAHRSRPRSRRIDGGQRGAARPAAAPGATRHRPAVRGAGRGRAGGRRLLRGGAGARGAGLAAGAAATSGCGPDAQVRIRRGSSPPSVPLPTPAPVGRAAGEALAGLGGLAF